MEANGYARITDFGVARKWREDNAEDTSGTPGYMSPEVICRMSHSFEADFFALGVIIYELMFATVMFLIFSDHTTEKTGNKLGKRC